VAMIEAVERSIAEGRPIAIATLIAEASGD
jgi:hypothetical protein